MTKHKVEKTVGSFAAALGRGIIAGIAGTAAITISQMIEMKITGRKPSTAPADAASKVLDIKPATEQDKQQFSLQVHWTYGTMWGVARALIAEAGLEGLPASILHFIAIWGTAMIIEPKLGVAPPVTEWELKSIAVDALHHAVYAAVTGVVYDTID